MTRCELCGPERFSIARAADGGWEIRNEQGRLVRVCRSLTDAEAWVTRRGDQ